MSEREISFYEHRDLRRLEPDSLFTNLFPPSDTTDEMGSGALPKPITPGDPDSIALEIPKPQARQSMAGNKELATPGPKVR